MLTFTKLSSFRLLLLMLVGSLVLVVASEDVLVSEEETTAATPETAATAASTTEETFDGMYICFYFQIILFFYWSCIYCLCSGLSISTYIMMMIPWTCIILEQKNGIDEYHRGILPAMMCVDITMSGKMEISRTKGMYELFGISRSFFFLNTYGCSSSYTHKIHAFMRSWFLFRFGNAFIYILVSFHTHVGCIQISLLDGLQSIHHKPYYKKIDVYFGVYKQTAKCIG